jgi:hypothetical protein
MSDSINVRVTLDSYDIVHPSEKQTQVYVQIPEVARASWLLPEDHFQFSKNEPWPSVVDSAQEYYAQSGTVSDPTSAAARGAVIEWLLKDENHDAMSEAWFQDRARRDPVSRSLLRDKERLEAQVAELEAQRERRRVRLVALQNDALSMRGSLSPNGEERKVPFPLGETLTPAVDWLIARVAELEAERHVTNEALSDAAEQLRANRDRIAELERPAEERRRAEIRSTYTELIAQAEQDRDYEGSAVVQQQLAEREAVWAREDELAKEFARDPLAMKPYVLGPSVEASADKLTQLLAPTQALRDDDPNHLRHTYRVSRDLPPIGGATC